MNEYDKKNLLRAARMIIGAHSDTIEIIRTKNLLNTKLIERSAKHTKDSNPLSSAMMCITNKFPIALDRNKAVRYRVPEQLLGLKDGKFIADTHMHGRILGKKEAIDWWVENSELPTDGQTEAINILYRQHRKEVNDFINMNWSQTRITFGEPVLARQMVETNIPFFKVDPKLKDSLVMQTFFPKYVTPNPLIDHQLI